MKTEQILGVEFFNGSAEDAVAQMLARGGLLVVPAAPALVNICYDARYREALLRADMAIADSGIMVLLWRFIRHRRVSRISGLTYLIRLLRRAELREAGAAFFVLPTSAAAEKARTWLRDGGFEVTSRNCYVAPQYGADTADAELVALLAREEPSHIVVGLGGGVQEKLGLYLRESLDYRPAIHCIGAALGFLTGDQKPIPLWADRLYLGWLLRLARNPRLYLRRFWIAHELPGLIWRYGAELPPLESRSAG